MSKEDDCSKTFKHVDWINEPISPYWYQNDPLLTHICNTNSVAVQHAEYYIIKHLRQLTAQIRDSILKSELERFLAEEKSHALVHRQLNQALKKHHPIRLISALIWFCYKLADIFFGKKNTITLIFIIEFFGCQLSLSFLRQDHSKIENKTLLSFLKWHAKEEIEHQAFPKKLCIYFRCGYLRRVLMFIYFGLIISLFLSIMIPILLMHDRLKGRKIRWRSFYSQLIAYLSYRKTAKRLKKNFLAFFSPRFMPSLSLQDKGK